MTQTERVIAAAKSYRGICQAELLHAHPPITRLAARIQDAKERGHVFEILPWRKGTKVYRWVEGPDVERVTGTSDTPSEDAGPCPRAGDSLSAGEERLFEVPTGESHWRSL